MKRTEDQYRVGLRSSVLADNQGFMKLSSVVFYLTMYSFILLVLTLLLRRTYLN